MRDPGHVASSSDVYYQGRYWNDLPQTVELINRRVSGDPEIDWIGHLRRSSGRAFSQALSLNSGNGWIERRLVAEGVVEKAIGVEYAADLIEEAREEARRQGLAIEYVQCDVNEASFPEGPYDLVVNHAAAHHITYLDRVFRAICELLPADGVFAGFDYVGPHRNQYPHDVWSVVHEVNDRLPEPFRQDLDRAYPRLQGAVEGDPTEAVHSELIVETLEHYFEVEEFRWVGGAIAYPLLTHNDAIFEAEPDDRDRWVEMVLDADTEFLDAHPDASLFAYFSARPDKTRLLDREGLARREAAEMERERQAAASGGRYYPLTAYQRVLDQLDDTRVRLADVEAELGALRGSRTWRFLDRVRRSAVGHVAARLLRRG